MAQVIHALMAVAGAAVLFASSLGAPAAQAASGAVLSPGWTLVNPSGCTTGQANGVTYLYIYPTSGGYLWTNEPDLVASLMWLCTVGERFYVHSLTGSSWDNTYVSNDLDQ